MPSEKERMLAGELYDASDPQLTEERRNAQALTRWYNETPPEATDRRRQLLGDLFGTLGEGAVVEPPFRCDYGYNVHVGDGFYANVGCVFLDVCSVRIGRNCLVGPGVHIYTATHPLDAATRVEGLEYGSPVSVGDGVWIGGRAVINPGVDIGDRSVVGSGAVVTEDIPDDVVVQGNPAQVVRELQ
jgi:maltose O-acetyltransferase